MNAVALLVIALVALGASALTLFSGFGLGTLLLPAFAWIFPLETAVAATAVVHLTNNGWKAWLVGRGASWRVVLRFGAPAMVAAFGGAWLLIQLLDAPLWPTPWPGAGVRPVAVLVGSMIVLFGLLDLVPRWMAWQVDAAWLPVGGVLSGFFGGLSGHQGALRSTFLTKVFDDPKVFIATGVWCAILVDVARLIVYGPERLDPQGAWLEVAVACVAALAGALLGKRLLGKTKMPTIRSIVGVLMVVTGLLIASGLLT